MSYASLVVDARESVATQIFPVYRGQVCILYFR